MWPSLLFMTIFNASSYSSDDTLSMKAITAASLLSISGKANSLLPYVYAPLSIVTPPFLRGNLLPPQQAFIKEKSFEYKINLLSFSIDPLKSNSNVPSAFFVAIAI